MPEWTSIIVFTAVSYITIFILSRIEGKRQVAQLEFMDYVVGITIGSIAAEMCTNRDLPWYYFVLAMFIFFLLDTIVTLIGRKGHWLKKILKGMPLTLIDNGNINYSNLKKSKLDVNNLLEMLRIQGFFNIQDVAFAILETSGDLSVLPISPQRPTVIEDLKLQEKPASLTENVVIDGKLLKDVLVSIKRSEQWALEQLKVKDKKDLKNIILAIYDEEKDTLVAYKKDMQQKRDKMEQAKQDKTKKEMGVKKD